MARSTALELARQARSHSEAAMLYRDPTQAFVGPTRSPRARKSRPVLIALNKPYGVLCQFTDSEGRATLADYVDMPGVYAAGRLDRDSEGLLLLSDDGPLIARLTDPRHETPKTYWAQVEGEIDSDALARLESGVRLNDGPTRPARARRLPGEPGGLWPRDPPIRFRAAIPTSWIELELREGRNRQVRRMTAAVGYPTLRLVRAAIGPVRVDGLAPGQWREIDPALFSAPDRRAGRGGAPSARRGRGRPPRA